MRWRAEVLPLRGNALQRIACLRRFNVRTMWFRTVPSLGRGERRYRINRLKARGQTTATETGLPSLRAGSQSGQLSKNSSTA